MIISQISTKARVDPTGAQTACEGGGEVGVGHQDLVGFGMGCVHVIFNSDYLIEKVHPSAMLTTVKFESFARRSECRRRT